MTGIRERLLAKMPMGTKFAGYYTNPDGPDAVAVIDELVEALEAAREALHRHYVDWDGEPEDAIPLQLARAKCDAVLAKVKP